MLTPLKDSYNRPIRDLRVSLTDRCNFRCFYCLPHGEPPIAPKEQMLSYEEIEYVCDIFVELGIEKIRLTGGEPMMRRDIETIIRKALGCSKPKGLRDLALTTNGYFLPDRAQGLKDAGLDRITISLDSLKPDTFKQMTGVDVLDRVLARNRSRERSRSGTDQDQCRHRARSQRRRGGGLCRLRARARREDALHRIHAARFRPRLVARRRGFRPRDSRTDKRKVSLDCRSRLIAVRKLLRVIVLLTARREKSASSRR